MICRKLGGLKEREFAEPIRIFRPVRPIAFLCFHLFGSMHKVTLAYWIINTDSEFEDEVGNKAIVKRVFRKVENRG